MRDEALILKKYKDIPVIGARNPWPAVTCIVNTHNRPALLPRALDSVWNQSYRDYEVIVVHDGPASAETQMLCTAYADKFDLLDINFALAATAEESGYQCVPKNLATYAARGDYIAYLDDDNEWSSDHLEVLVAAMEAGTVWPDFAYGRRKYVIDAGYTPVNPLPTGDSPYVPWNNDAMKRLGSSNLSNFIDTSDALISKGALWSLHVVTDKMWNEEIRRFGDWELFTRGVFFANWRGASVDRVVQTYHWHGSNIQLTRPAQETPSQRNISLEN